MQSQTRKRYLVYLLLVAVLVLSAASVNSQERNIAPSETKGCNCATASLMGDTVGTQFGGGPVANRLVNSSVELPNCGPTLGAAGPSPRWNIDYGSDTIRVDFLQQIATYGAGAAFVFSSLDPQLAGCPPAFINGITVTTNKPTSPFNVVSAATFGPHTVTIQIAPTSGNLDWKPGEFILVRLRFACDTLPEQPPVDPCCPPINQSVLKTLLVYHGSGSISAPYTLHFQPTSSFDSQMQGYIDYLANFGFNSLIVDWTLINQGNGNTVGTGQTTWNSPGNGNPVVLPLGGFFAGFPMQVNTWYVIHTVTHLKPGQVFFSEKCAVNDIKVQVQVLPAAKGSEPVLQFSDGKTVIKSIPINEKRQQQN